MRNVGRRDGLAVVTLAAYEEMGSLPGYYVQAVGSGAGGIATYEAASRIVRTSTGGDTIPRLFLCQNSEFTPIYDAWKHTPTHSRSRRRSSGYTPLNSSTPPRRSQSPVASGIF